MSINVKKIVASEDILKCVDVLYELRPHLNGKDITAMFKTMEKEGFKAIYVEQEGKAVAFAGYRRLTKFYDGRTIYIDDLCTLPNHRGKGYSGALLDYIIAEAKAEGLDAITLDSGPHRHDAHRLYLNKGFNISSHHFFYRITPWNLT